MKSLIRARKEAGLTQTEIVEMAGITQASLCNTERGLSTPDEKTRKKLELLLGKINWLDVPRLSIRAIDPPTDWHSCERQFRRLIKELKSLPEDEQIEFIKSAKKHLEQIIKENNIN